MLSRKQKKLLRRLVLSLLTIGLIAVVSWMGYQWWLYRRIRLTRYPEFGIYIPDGYTIHGIDVSKYQQTIAWDAVQTMNVRDVQLGFAFIKATEGIDTGDPQ